MVKYFKIIAIVLVLSLLFSGCNILSSESEDTGKINIMTTLFPIYDFTRQIVQDKGDVALLLPPGVESHSYDPTPRDIVKVRNSDIFIYTGEYMEPWAHRIVDNAKNENLLVINSGEGITLVDEDHEDEDDDHEDEDDDHGDKDPHIWVDPILAIEMIENILDGIINKDPESEDFYVHNANILIEDLKELNLAFEDLVLKSKTNTIMFGGHFAFRYFTLRYNLEYLSPYPGFAPNAEPSPQKIAQLIDNMNEASTRVIYFEELVDPKVARVISDETNAQMLLLHAGHNITKEDLETQVTYIDIMYNNLENLKIGLEYEE